MIKADLMGMEWADVTVADFNFLNQSGDAQLTRVLDAETWICTRESLEMFNWKGESLRTLARSLGIILRLGNLSFSETDDGKAKISSRKELDILAESFGVSSEEIETAMTRRVINTAQEEVEVPLSAEAAKDACDAFIKRMYSVLFESVVRRVNFLTNAPASLEIQGTVSLVDIFGFENFEVNRFEQLCINYVNEKMQQKYVQDNLRRFTAEYKEEGIELFDYKLVDNSEILTLFEGRNGVINSLNEESVRPCGSNEVRTSLNAAKYAHQMLAEILMHLLHTFPIRCSCLRSS
jgi:myosin heavy subunit